MAFKLVVLAAKKIEALSKKISKVATRLEELMKAKIVFLKGKI